MTATPGFLKTLETVAGRKLRGIRDSIPQGYLLGRASSGNGPPEVIAIASLLAGIKRIVGGIAANPTATASDVAVNGIATTFMRSDAAPAVQKTSSTQFGLAKVDGTSITAVGGVISSSGGGGGGGQMPLVNGDTPGPSAVANGVGQFIGVPV